MTNEFAYSRMSFTAAFKRNVTQVSVYLAQFRKDVFVRTKHPPICIVSLNYALKATLLRRKGALILVFPRVRRFGEGAINAEPFISRHFICTRAAPSFEDGCRAKKG